MNTQEKKEALVQAVEEIAGKEAAYWEGNPKMQETFRNCYVSTAKPRQNFLRAEKRMYLPEISQPCG